MKVHELIKRLEKFDSDDEVKFSCESHDYWKNQLAMNVHDVTNGYVTWSEYHQTFLDLDEDQVERLEEELGLDADEDREEAEDLDTTLGRQIAEKTPKHVVMIR